jgi:hypothetical protein
VSTFRPFFLPQPRVCFRNQRPLPSYAPRNVNISTILSTLRILPVTTGVYPNRPLAPIPEPSSISFRINTCKSVSKQTTSTPCRIIHLCKTRRGEGLLLTSRVSFFSLLRSQCPLCPCLPRPGRSDKSHVLSGLPPLWRSLRSFSHSLPLFPITCRLFYENTGGWGAGYSRRSDIPTFRPGDVQTIGVVQACSLASRASPAASVDSFLQKVKRTWFAPSRASL